MTGKPTVWGEVGKNTGKLLMYTSVGVKASP